MAEIHDKIMAVMEAVTNVEKTGRNEFHGYDYVEAQELVRLIRAELVKQKLIIIPRCQERYETEQRDGVSSHVMMIYEITDGTDKVEIGPIPGEGWDKGDKATPKALTNAFKYALIQGFAIPAGDDPEADEKTDIAAELQPAKQADLLEKDDQPDYRIKEPELPATPKQKNAIWGIWLTMGEKTGVSDKVWLEKGLGEYAASMFNVPDMADITKGKASTLISYLKEHPEEIEKWIQERI